jgi:hypothetical protein
MEEKAMKRTILTSVGVALLLTGCGESAADREARLQEQIREDIKKTDEDNERALREGLKGQTWTKKSEDK